ncbi:MAG: Rrf2 family transcriptional regulator [Fidelibacterota bacterium]|nr:MAG: Rrf2 family transcriptional regulator [Candidatus Neomarinimicrobiota bacterium]
MLYSKAAEYAIQAMIYLAEHEGNSLSMVATIAKQYQIPQQYLAKIIQTLTKHGLVESYRGRGGGLKLAKPANDITLLQIVHAIDGPPPEQEQCVIGLDVCSDEAECPLHNEWTHIKSLIRDTLEHQSLAKLAEGMRTKRQELADLLRGSKAAK